MKVTLIKPKMGHIPIGFYQPKAVMEPLELALLAALTPPDVEVVVYDDRIEGIPYDEPTDLVAITVETFTAKRAYEISHEYEKRGIPVIMGGHHPTLLPDETKSHADSVYIGDAEDLWAKVISDARRGKLDQFYRARYGPPQPKLFPRRDIFKGKSYLPIKLIQFSRGCRFDCKFCSISAFYKQNHFTRPPEDVVAEIEAQDHKVFIFVDDNIVMNFKAAKELFRALAPLKIRWFSQASINMAHDLELMDLMVKSGCVGHLVGIDSINEDSLKWMKKTPNLLKFDHYKSQLKIIRDCGLLVWGAFTLGHEYDTIETIERTVEFALQYKFTLADFNLLMPYPNTPLYHELARDKRLLFDGQWWIHPDYRVGHAAFRPYRMSPEELTKGCFEAYERFYSMSSVIRRAFDFKTNMKSLFRFSMYHLCNTVSRNDYFKRRDMILGESSVVPQRGAHSDMNIATSLLIPSTDYA